MLPHVALCCVPCVLFLGIANIINFLLCNSHFRVYVSYLIKQTQLPLKQTHTSFLFSDPPQVTDILSLNVISPNCDSWSSLLPGELTTEMHCIVFTCGLANPPSLCPVYIQAGVRVHIL